MDLEEGSWRDPVDVVEDFLMVVGAAKQYCWFVSGYAVRLSVVLQQAQSYQPYNTFPHVICEFFFDLGEQLRIGLVCSNHHHYQRFVSALRLSYYQIPPEPFLLASIIGKEFFGVVGPDELFQ